MIRLPSPSIRWPSFSIRRPSFSIRWPSLSTRWPSLSTRWRGAGLVMLTLASGCGFHLRGVGIDSAMASAQIREIGRAPVSRELEKLLRGAGVEIVEEGKAEAVIELLDQTEERRGVSVTDRARTAEYELTLEVRYRALAADGTELVPERLARVERVYRLDPNNIVGSHEQEALLRREMEREAVRQIVASLDAAARTRAEARAGQTS